VLLFVTMLALHRLIKAPALLAAQTIPTNRSVPRSLLGSAGKDAALADVGAPDSWRPSAWQALLGSLPSRNLQEPEYVVKRGHNHAHQPTPADLPLVSASNIVRVERLEATPTSLVTA
jgi:hypothetical protein